MRIILAITGASGTIYGIRLLEELHLVGAEVHLVISSAAKKIMTCETSYKLADVRKLAVETYEEDDIAAILASGSFSCDGAAVVPCSLKTLAAIASGYEHILKPSRDGKMALFVYDPQVPGMHPPIYNGFCGCIRFVPVSGAHIGTV